MLFGYDVLHCYWLPLPPQGSMKVTSSVVQVATAFLHTHPYILFYVYRLYSWATSFFCVPWRLFFVIPGYVLYVMLRGSVSRVLLWMSRAAVRLTARETAEHLTVTFKFSVRFLAFISPNSYAFTYWFKVNQSLHRPITDLDGSSRLMFPDFNTVDTWRW